LTIILRESSGLGEILVDAMENCHLRLDILLRPGVVRLNACLVPHISKMYFMSFSPRLFSYPFYLVWV
jgi:hypothetical protein